MTIIINFHVRYINHLYQLLIIILIIIVMDNFLQRIIDYKYERERERKKGRAVYLIIYIVINNGRQAHFLRHGTIVRKKNKFYDKVFLCQFYLYLPPAADIIITVILTL